MIERTRQCVRRGLALLLVLALTGAPAFGQTKRSITWLLRDFPPLSIFAGPQEGQGAIDRFMPLLFAKMPEYEHELVRVNRARGMQMLQDPTSLVCDPTLLWTEERARSILYSIPAYATQGNGITLRREQLTQYAPYVAQGEIDLAGLLRLGGIRIGVVAERSYGPGIDKLLQQVPVDDLSVHYGNDAIGALLSMQRMGRIDLVISYPPEARFQAQRRGLDPDDLVFLRVKGTPKYQFAHVGCSETAEGRQAMEIVNREMRMLRKTVLVKLYADWVTPDQRAEYLKDAQAFFQEIGEDEQAKETQVSGESARGKP